MMRKGKICLLLLVVLSIWIFAGSAPATADPPDITGQWYGTWEVAEYAGWTSNFSMIFWDSPYGLLAIMYVPEFGLFDEYLPVTIEESPAGYLVTIGVAGYSEIWGVLDGDSLSGFFYAFFDGDPPFMYTGIWYAERYTGQEVSPGEAPGASCNALPPLYCMGDAEYCSELVPFEPTTGPGYLDYPSSPETDENRYFSYLRRDLMLLVKYATAKIACKTADWDYGNFAPLGLDDMSEADGSTPGTSFGFLRHPLGTHDGGRDIDTGYYQLYAADNLFRAVGVHYDGYFEALHLVEPAYALDVWRTALFIAYLSEHPRVRVIGVDGQIGLVLEDAFDELVELGWIDPDLRESIPLAYEVEDTGLGWYYFHHTHMHISMNRVYDIVSSAELEPDTLNKESEGKFVTAHIEFIEVLDASQIDTSSVALILDGYTMLYAEPQDVRISDYNENGIADLTVKFDRQEALESMNNGDVEISITGLVDGVFFQESDTIRVLGNPPSGLEQAGERHGRPHVPFVRPGGRGM
jgi:hypothetical protein